MSASQKSDAPPMAPTPSSLRVFCIEPAHDSRIDAVYVPATKETWQDALDLAEQSMDRQFNEGPWDEIKVTITCKTLTRQEWEEIEGQEY